ncbi:MAG: hypothetical protein EU532_14690 [Promethearchaeota archaeon]|nr:MAG: hypothetical protein EU532_14690 [Candidatus Lokiarchaeota archaeon]
MKEKNKEESWTFSSKYWMDVVLIFLGIFIRIFMLIFYYYVNSNPSIPWGGWGDVDSNYYDIDTIFTGEWIWNQGDLPYPPLSIYFLLSLRILSFGIFELYVFYAFLLEFCVAISFYFVLKRFSIPKRNFIFGIFLLNPFYFLSYVFSASNCGYHITDSFFLLFLMISLYFCPKENKSLFYLFLGLAMCAKWYTLPAAPYFIIKYFLEKEWSELKKIFLFIGIPIIIFLVSPIFYLPNYLDLYFNWLSITDSSYENMFLFYLKLIPFFTVFILYLVLRLKDADRIEITFVSIILMNLVMLWFNLFVRYLTPLILYGHLKTNNKIIRINLNLKVIRIKFNIGNHLLTFILSILGCIAAILIIIFIFQ